MTAAAQARRLHSALLARGETLATAESLTGGALGVALTAMPGASLTYRGGVTAYATDLKARLLGVDADLLAEVGAVHPEVARAMADGVRDRLGSTYGLSTTGVAGPDPQDGQPPGVVHVGLAGPELSYVTSLQLTGNRATVRNAAVLLALELAVDHLAATADGEAVQ